MWAGASPGPKFVLFGPKFDQLEGFLARKFRLLARGPRGRGGPAVAPGSLGLNVNYEEFALNPELYSPIGSGPAGIIPVGKAKND